MRDKFKVKPITILPIAWVGFYGIFWLYCKLTHHRLIIATNIVVNPKKKVIYVDGFEG